MAGPGVSVRVDVLVGEGVGVSAATIGALEVRKSSGVSVGNRESSKGVASGEAVATNLSGGPKKNIQPRPNRNRPAPRMMTRPPPARTVRQGCVLKKSSGSKRPAGAGGG